MAGGKDDERPLTQQAVFRIGVILFSVLVVFALVRQMLIPDTYGQYGRYRGDSVGEVAALEVQYAGGIDDCKECHLNASKIVTQGEHSGLDCQSCHGPSAVHVNSPQAGAPKIGETIELCSTCHQKIAGRTDELIATVRPLMHSGGVDCVRCHDPHLPWAKLGGKKA